MNNEFYLDLNTNKLRVHESIKPLSIVVDYVVDVEKGDQFPAVPVKQIGKNLYSLIYINEYGDSFGGHKRAVAHYIANKPLLCRIGRGLEVPESEEIYVEDILLFI